MGHSRLLSPDEFRSSFHSFAASLSSVDASAEATDAAISAITFPYSNAPIVPSLASPSSLPPLSCDDIHVETPFRVIDRAIDREEAAYHSLTEAIAPLQPISRAQPITPIDISKALPTFGSSVPSAAELRQPLLGLMEQRTKSLRRRAVLTSENAISGMDILSSAARSSAPVPLLSDQVLLRVTIHDSTRYCKLGEYLVLDSQPLTALRDAITGCLSDEAEDIDWKGTQNRFPKRLDGEKQTPSGFFFIENTFYDDMRSKRAIRYSDPIVKWVREFVPNPGGNAHGQPPMQERFLQHGLFPYIQKNMEDVLISDLKIRLGAHYLYQHQGHCRHLVIFTEMRMRCADDINDATLYPLPIFKRKVRLQKCCICNEFCATYVTYNDKFAPSSPAFYCSECYQITHITVDGSLAYWDYSVFKTIPLIEPLIPVPPLDPSLPVELEIEDEKYHQMNSGSR